MYYPIECSKYAGWFYIPGYSKYRIDANGRVLNVTTDKILRGSINPDGYHLYRITNDDGVTKTWGRYRLKCWVFNNPQSPICKLVVNHINGIKNDDDLSNLEWTSHQGNVHHAGLNNLTSKCRPIEVYDVKTGKITFYSSFIECARAIGISKDAVSHRLKAKRGRTFPEGKQYRFFNEETNWDIKCSEDYYGPSKKVLVRFLLDNSIVEFESLSVAAINLDVALSTASVWINTKGLPVLPGFIQIQWSKTVTRWRHVKDPYLELELFTKKRIIAGIDTNNSLVRIYTSCVECAKELNVKPNTFNYHLKTNNKFVFNGIQYMYYSSYRKSGPHI